MEEKLYLVIIDLYEDEENAIVDICTSREVAEKLIDKYLEDFNNFIDCDAPFNYHIDEITIDYSKDILWNCYNNSSFNNV